MTLIFRPFLSIHGLCNFTKSYLYFTKKETKKQQKKPAFCLQKIGPAKRSLGLMMRATRFELVLPAWEADVLPLNYARINGILKNYSRFAS